MGEKHGVGKRSEPHEEDQALIQMLEFIQNWS